ncbi:TIGR02757 family protein [Treponema socranskii subsp. paredis ATCC 35535]|nr:TIGR02757 family protein [Treponema socranskii subsp. paredis ATCC 35535]
MQQGRLFSIASKKPGFSEFRLSAPFLRNGSAAPTIPAAFIDFCKRGKKIIIAPMANVKIAPEINKLAAASKRSFKRQRSIEVSARIKKLLRELADAYETREFSAGDPSRIVRCYRSARDIEVAAFITAMLSFGKREQFLQKTGMIFALAGKHPAQWIRSGAWQSDFPRGTRKFYRFFSYDDMRDLFAALQKILEKHPSFGAYVKKAYEAECAVRREIFRVHGVGIKSADRTESEHNVSSADIKLASCKLNKKSESGEPSVTGIKAANRKTSQTESFSPSSALLHVIADAFPQCRAVPQKSASANKRTNMFLRWMVRTNSPVDAGLWTWFSPADLLIPLDTHVLRQAKNFGLISERSAATEKTAHELTDVLKRIWPDDPCRGDFALFGPGVSGENISDKLY